MNMYVIQEMEGGAFFDPNIEGHKWNLDTAHIYTDIRLVRMQSRALREDSKGKIAIMEITLTEVN